MMAEKCVKMLIHTTRKSIQHKLIDILHPVDCDILSDQLSCSRVAPRHLCMLLFCEDFLSAFCDHILMRASCAHGPYRRSVGTSFDTDSLGAPGTDT